MRTYLITLSLLALTACAPSVPNSGASGVGFGTEIGGGGIPATVATPPQTIQVAGETATVNTGSVDISDEQDFGAVAGRESIDSDAARIASNREVYVIVEPRELPVRTDNSLSLVVEFALATNNPVGQPLYRRSGFMAERRFNRSCAKFTSADLAQEAFLNRGGPQRDSKGMDPDGDGFACYWNPVPYRQARFAAQEVVPEIPPSE